ncbi:MAG: hypothetical protein H6Q66_627 [Firmicutes bacterium]|nr:hypothetical protein [Bacillota bacterium]
MLHICLSFDHELFLGDNFATEKEILIDTTDRLLGVLEKHQVSGTFFTDVCSIMRYEELGMNEFPNLVKEQLQRLVNSGQDVQLHIHSNWLKSCYVDGKWNFDTDSYRVQYYTEANREKNNNWTMMQIIKKGKELLENLLRSEWNEYSCVAYRAGGFCIQPEKELVSCLIENGIFIDSSIAPGISALNCVNSYDFRENPRKVMNWFISPTSGINGFAESCEQKKIFEVPIATANRDFVQWILTKKKYINTRPHRGSFISFKECKGEDTRIERNDIFSRLRKFYSMPVVLSLDSYDAQILYSFVKQIYRKYRCDDHDVYISVICHPKLVNEKLLDNLDRFIKNMQKIPNVRFCNMKHIYEKVKKEGKI